MVVVIIVVVVNSLLLLLLVMVVIHRLESAGDRDRCTITQRLARSLGALAKNTMRIWWFCNSNAAVADLAWDVCPDIFWPHELKSSGMHQMKNLRRSICHNGKVSFLRILSTLVGLATWRNEKVHDVKKTMCDGPAVSWDAWQFSWKHLEALASGMLLRF